MEQPRIPIMLADSNLGSWKLTYPASLILAYTGVESIPLPSSALDHLDHLARYHQVTIPGTISISVTLLSSSLHHKFHETQETCFFLPHPFLLPTSLFPCAAFLPPPSPPYHESPSHDVLFLKIPLQPSMKCNLSHFLPVVTR